VGNGERAKGVWILGKRGYGGMKVIGVRDRDLRTYRRRKRVV
jgi:hypothetical protein